MRKADSTDMRLRVDRWWLCCLLVAVAVFAYTGHAVTLTSSDHPAGHRHLTATASASPTLTCPDDDGVQVEHECCITDVADHQPARHSTTYAATTTPQTSPATATPADGVHFGRSGGPPRLVSRALLQVWRH